MTGDQNPAPGPAPGVPIKVTPEILLQVLTTPPASGPAPFPAVPVDLPAPADIANGALFAAGNSGVPGDVESSGLEDLDRRAHAADAVQKFSANEADAAQQFQGVGAQAEAQGATQMMQQAVSGITGALGGAVGGVMGPLTQLPQQAMQAGQGAMQPLMSALQQTYGAEGLDVADGARLVDSIEGEPGLGGEPGAGDVGAGGGGGGTTPTGYLGPPPVPTSSPPTTPAGAPAKSVTPDPVSGTDQNSGHLFYNRRLRAATTRFSVRMKHDDRKQTAALALSMVLVAIAAGWMMLLNVLKPTGIVGDSAIIGDRDSGALYARIDGRLYPALNLTSARLATGTAGQPTWVKPAEIAKYPTGPLVGIPGAPAAMPVNRGAVSAWAVCDTAGRPRSADKPVVTSIAGPITGGGRATHLRDDAGLLVTFDGSTYVIWGGKRSQIDPTNRAVTLSLGLDPGVTSPIQISRALFDGLPATEPLRVPAVPEAGTPSTWVPGARVGSVLQAQTAGGGSQFYVLLPDGVQKISSFVADLLRSANSYGAAAPRVVTPDVLVHTPQVTSLPVEYYPAGRLNFVDTAADPTTCVSWEKASTDPQARVAVYNGRGLPVPPSMDSRIVRLVRDDRAPASVVATQVLVLPGAANFVTSTSGVITAESRESLFWVSGNGVRFGIANDEATLRALGLDPGAAVQAPWPLLRTFAAGPALSRDAALLARDTVPTLGQVAIVTTTAKAGA